MPSNQFNITRRSLLKAGTMVAITAAIPFSVNANANRPLRYAFSHSWSNIVAQTYIGAQLIRERVGYPVELVTLEPALAFAALQSGQADLYSDTYLEGLDALNGDYRGGMAEYVKKVADSIDIVGIAQGPQSQGLAVPKYVTINSIDELNSSADKFSNQIIGIEPGSGVMNTVEEVIKAYDLKLQLRPGSDATVAAAVKRAVLREEWIVVTAWEPTPIWNQVELKYLEDPKKLLMKESYYNFHSVRKDFVSNFPKALDFLKKFQMSVKDIAQVMDWIDGGQAPDAAADRWIKSNAEKVEKWFS